jgi:hypothetical protein
MDHNTPRVSQRSLESLVEETLDVIFKALDELEDSPRVREVRAKAHSYKRIVTKWTTVPPSAPQREATFDLVIDLHEKLTELRGPRLPSTPARKPGSGR